MHQNLLTRCDSLHIWHFVSDLDFLVSLLSEWCVSWVRLSWHSEDTETPVLHTKMFVDKRKENMCQCLSRPLVWDVWNFPGIVKDEKINECSCSRGQRGESRSLTGQKRLVSSHLVRLLRPGFLAWSLGFSPAFQLPGEIPPSKNSHLFLPFSFSGWWLGPDSSRAALETLSVPESNKRVWWRLWWSSPSDEPANRLVLVAFRGWAE